MTNISIISPSEFTSLSYDEKDINLIPSFEVDTSFGEGSYIEYYIFDLNKSIISVNYDYDLYSIQNDLQSSLTNNISKIQINPEQDLSSQGFFQGSYYTYYSFLNKKIGSPSNFLYITEISTDRTEIRLDSNTISKEDLVKYSNDFITERESNNFFTDFYLNFGDNNLIIANNIKLDNEDPNNPSILIKLYNALPPSFDIKSEGWVVTLLENPIAYEIEFEDEIIEFNDKIKLRGPNFNLDVKDQINNSTPLMSYDSLLSSPSTGLSTQINTLLNDRNIEINIDYSDFNNFIHFSSAYTRLANFYNKVYLLEEYSSSISQIQSSVTGTSTGSLEVLGSIQQFNEKSNSVLNSFDRYEYFLYYASSSYSWPKTTSSPPYTLASTTDPITLSWFGSTNESSPLYGGIILSASLYDAQNKDYLAYSIPEYLREDPQNQSYELFVDMLGQHYDNIWMYIKDVTTRFDADNRLDYGISKDLIADAIRDLGVKIYQNNFSTNDLYSAFLGITENGDLSASPFITGSLPTPQGYEYIDTLISASNDTIPLDDVNKSLYKRIYHNLPYLLKSKGTLAGLRALITSYGIPDTILRISEFGGKNKINANDWDYWYNLYNHQYTTQGDNVITTDWELNPLWSSSNNTPPLNFLSPFIPTVPSTIQLRFKAETPIPTLNSQSIWFLDSGNDVALVLEYTGSGLISGSYSGSQIDPYHQYANLKFTTDGFATSSSIYLPFFNGDWWGAMITKDGNDYNLHTGNKIYNANENNIIGFYQTSSHSSPSTTWNLSTTSSFGGISPITVGATTYSPLTGSLQEIRYYTSVLNENPFKDYVMNPLSFEGNTLNSSPNELAFRASLGGELNTGNTSIHPKVTGSWDITSSFTAGSDFNYYTTPIYTKNEEWVFLDQLNAGIKNRINNKIQLRDGNIPEGNTLSVIRSLNQQTDEDSSYSPHVNYLEVAFSPQNEINDDIDSQIGYFNIGELIGDPILRNSYQTSYPELDKLRNEYFLKYIKNYDVYDYIRLIKYFDNSLFKMIKDFIPARTSLASGVVIKQHKLERNRYPQPKVQWEDNTLSGSIAIGEYSGGTGGSFEKFNGVNTSPYGPNGNGPENIFNVTQSWVEITPSLLGEITSIHDTQDEFYNGEFSGSQLIVTQQNINPGCDPFKKINPSSISYYGIRIYTTGILGEFYNLTSFLSPLNSPTIGYISVWYEAVGSFRSVEYIKISKIDNNGVDQTNTLQTLQQITLRWSVGPPSFNVYEIISITEYNNFYLYKVSPNSLDTSTIVNNRAKIEYDFTGSVTGSQEEIFSGNNKYGTILDIDPITDNLNFLNSNKYNLNTYPQKDIFIYATGSVDFEQNNWLNGAVTPSIELVRENLNGSDDVLDEYIFSNIGGGSSINYTFEVSSSIPISSTPGAKYFLQLVTQGVGGALFELTSSISSESRFYVTSSIASGPSIETVPEPSQSENFSNAFDCQPLYGNASENQTSYKWMQVDHTTGLMIPINFDLIISGSALKAQVQDSNYTLKRHINSRYNGSKNTTEFINKWTDSGLNEGNYGKTPSIESKKSIVVWAQDTRGWAPEKMDRSLVTIKYLIDETGKAITPNAVETSLGDVQNAFRSGENIILTTFDQTLSSNNFSDTVRVIDRGGVTIEPILYNQISHYQDPPMSFTGSIFLSNISALETNLDVRATMTDNGDGTLADLIPINQFSQRLDLFDDLTFEGSNLTGTGAVGNNQHTYEITQDVLDLSGSLNISCRVTVTPANPQDPSVTNTYTSIKLRSSIQGDLSPTVFNQNLVYGEDSILEFNVTIPTYDFTLSETLRINAQTISHANNGPVYYRRNGQNYFKITHTPSPPTTINSGSLFNLPPSGGEDTALWINNPNFLSIYQDPNVKQQNIPNSKFNPINLPIEFLPGDEIRFEGDEGKVAEVIRVTQTTGSGVYGSDPLLLIYTNKNLSVVNWDVTKFAVRRYVDNPNQIIISRNAVLESQPGPLLVKPDYITNQLNENLDDYIIDLTNKGLI